MRVVVAWFYLLVANAALADTIHLGAQWGLPNGYSQAVGCLTPGSQCVTIATGKTIRRGGGTHTIKIQGVELLAVVMCGRPDRSAVEVLWVGHHLSSSPTVTYSVPSLPADLLLAGDGVNACWLEYEAINNGQATVDGGGIEIHSTLVAE